MNAAFLGEADPLAVDAFPGEAPVSGKKSQTTECLMQFQQDGRLSSHFFRVS
jgi:hypothetical protein